MAQDDPASPCIRSCTLHPDSDVCLGCFRTLEEIVSWSSYCAEEKSAVLGKLEERRREYYAAIERRRRGL